MKVLIKAGAEIDVPTRDELREDIHGAVRVQSELERAWVRGVKPMRTSAPWGSGNAYVSPPVPQGYCWVLMLAGVTLGASDQLQVFVNSDNTTITNGQGNIIYGPTTNSAGATFPVSQAATFPKGAVVLFTGDTFSLKAVGGQQINRVFWAVIELPAERIGELLI